jgi:low temperature requirement protein LtrA
MTGMSTTAPASRDHRLRRMTGRDPDEPHRSATPLELLFDLMFVVAFSQAGTQAAHLLELGHYAPAIGAFAFSAFAICWAWINCSWQASAFDNDDVFFRVATLVQMTGVLIVALGLPQMFHSIDEGVHVDNSVVVAGYVVMRASTIALWLRAARHNPEYRRCALTYAGLFAIAQAGWVVQIFVDPPLAVTAVIVVVLVVFEMLIPFVAERRAGGTPWHAHHIAERYGLLVIITLGEIVLGTILAVSAVVEVQGWSVEAVLLACGGTALAFGLWWCYFTMPSAEVLERHRDRGFTWGYGHMVVFGSLAATGAGLHVAATVIEHVAHIGAAAAILTVVIPVAVFTTALFTLYSLLLRQFDPFHLLLFVGALAALAVSAVAVAAGASMGVGIVIAACSPLIVVVGFETVGHRHQSAALERVLA